MSVCLFVLLSRLTESYLWSIMCRAHVGDWHILEDESTCYICLWAS